MINEDNRKSIFLLVEIFENAMIPQETDSLSFLYFHPNRS